MTNKRNVFIYIHPLTHLFGVAGPSQVFWEANALIPDVYKLHFVSFTPNITSAQGLGLTNIQSLMEVDPSEKDLIIVPGVNLNEYLSREPGVDETNGLAWIKKQHEKGVQMFSIGSGTLILADAGILDGKKCTSHWKCTGHFKNNYPKIKFIESKIFIRDRNIITSAGMSATIDSTLAIIEEDHGPVFTARLALELLIFIRRFGDERQQSYFLDYKTHFNPLVHQAQNIISSNLSKNYTNAQLAELINTSERNLTRTFKKTVGISITQFKNKLRIELTRHLLHNKSLSVSQIAAECGFNNARQLRRLWKREVGGSLKS